MIKKNKKLLKAFLISIGLFAVILLFGFTLSPLAVTGSDCIEKSYHTAYSKLCFEYSITGIPKGWNVWEGDYVAVHCDAPENVLYIDAKSPNPELSPCDANGCVGTKINDDFYAFYFTPEKTEMYFACYHNNGEYWTYQAYADIGKEFFEAECKTLGETKCENKILSECKGYKWESVGQCCASDSDCSQTPIVTYKCDGNNIIKEIGTSSCVNQKCIIANQPPEITQTCEFGCILNAGIPECSKECAIDSDCPSNYKCIEGSCIKSNPVNNILVITGVLLSLALIVYGAFRIRRKRR